MIESDMKRHTAKRAHHMLLSALLFLIGSPAWGAEGGFTVRPLSLKDCIQIALEHNLDVKIERITPEIARFDLNLAYANYEPVFSGSAVHQSSFEQGGLGSTSPVGTMTKNDSFVTGVVGMLPTGLSYELVGNAANARTTNSLGRSESSQASISIQLRQPLLKNSWIDEARLNIQIGRNLLKISELSLRQQIMNTVTSVELAYYDLKLAQQNVQVQQQALRLAEELLAADRDRVEQGVLASLDEKQAGAQVASQRAILLVAQRLLAAQQNIMKGLLCDKISAWKDVLIEPTNALSAQQVAADRQSSWQKGLTRRPDFLQAKLEIERLGCILRFTHNQLFPQLDLVGSYGFGGGASEYAEAFGDIQHGSSPSYSFGAVVSIPLGNSAARNNYKIGKAGQQQALVKLQRLEQSIMLQIEDAVNLVQTNFERIGATVEAREFAEAALEAEQTKLENGKSASFFVLQLQRDLTAARSVEIQALADYNKSLALLALQEGSVFERNNLKLKGR
jgi:outer membrane protein TolC